MTVQIAHHLFTIHDYHQMHQAGIFTEEDRVELLHGEIYAMSPIGPTHASVVNRINRLFSRQLSDDLIVSIQNPIQLSDLSEPEPDIAILQMRDDFYTEAHPTPEDIVLLIEVADTSIDYDRMKKLPRFAEASIAEVWLVDIEQRQIEQYTRPRGNTYLDKQTWSMDETVVAKVDSALKLEVAAATG